MAVLSELVIRQIIDPAYKITCVVFTALKFYLLGFLSKHMSQGSISWLRSLFTNWRTCLESMITNARSKQCKFNSIHIVYRLQTSYQKCGHLFESTGYAKRVTKVLVGVQILDTTQGTDSYSY